MKSQREIITDKLKKEIHKLVLAIDKTPTDWRNYNDLAVLLIRMENYSEAEELIMKAFGQVATGDKQATENLKYTLGNVYYAAGEYEKAVALYNQISDNDIKGEALIMLAQSMQQVGDFKRGLLYAITALEVKPADVELNNLTADMLLALGDFKQAQIYYKKVLALDEKNSAALFGSGLIALVFDQDAQIYFDKIKKYDLTYFNQNKQKVDDLAKLIKNKNL